MVESWLPGKLSLPCNGRRNAPRWHHFTCRSEYDAGRAGTAAYFPLLKDEQNRQASKSEPRAICGRLHHYRKFKGATGTRSQTSCGAIHERTRTRSLTREDGH